MEETNRIIPSPEELASFAGVEESEINELVEQITTEAEMSEEDAKEYREKVLSDEKKVKIIRKKLQSAKAGLDLKLALLDSMYMDIEDPEKRQEKILEERLKCIQEATKIEVALFTTRKNGKYMRSSAYKFTPNVGMNRRQRRLMNRMR